jgi:hypothetical protein
MIKMKDSTDIIDLIGMLEIEELITMIIIIDILEMIEVEIETLQNNFMMIKDKFNIKVRKNQKYL